MDDDDGDVGDGLTDDTAKGDEDKGLTGDTVGDGLTGDTAKADEDQGLTGDTQVPGLTGDIANGDDDDEYGLTGNADANVDDDFVEDREM